MAFLKQKLGFRDLLIGIIISIPFSIFFVSMFLIGRISTDGYNPIQRQTMSILEMMMNKDENVVSEWYLGDTDPNSIETFNLEKETYLDNGAIFYFRYQLKEKYKREESNETVDRSGGNNFR